MKKKSFLAAVFVMFFTAFCLSACCDGGNTIPGREKMQENLTDKGYTVQVFETIDFDGGIYAGSKLTAFKDGEFLEFFWTDSAELIGGLFEDLETRYPNYNHLVSNYDLVFCGSEQAVKDAGIKIVKVDVDVKVKI